MFFAPSAPDFFVTLLRMKKYAIFSDIDGTLVSFHTHCIPDSTIQAITEARERGHRFYISTGRPVAIIQNLSAISHLIHGFITTNGAFCFIGEHQVCRHALHREDVHTILEDADRNDYPCIVVGEKDLAVYHYTDQVKRIFHDELGVEHLDYTVPVSALKGQHILQITPFVTHQQETSLMPRLQHCTSGRWHPEFTDITDADADKGKGLLAMAKYTNTDINLTLALGDGGNDIPIIRQAGIGIAMGNATEETKKAADFITDSVDENGFANALRHFGLIS